MFYNPNVTIAFSGYNIKNMALLAIDSLLKIYPKTKYQILYFDDCSTDGTVQALREKGIKTISWDTTLLRQYNTISEKHPEWSIGQKLSVRVSYILESIVREIQTDFLLLNDGDILFKTCDFLEHFEQQSEDYDIVYQRDNLYQPKQYQQEIIEKINNRYTRKVVSDEAGNTYWRMFHAHVFLNVKRLKELGITSDCLDEETAILTEGGLIDTFSDFTNRVLESGELRIKEEPILDNDIIHFGGQASDRKGLKNGLSIELADDGGYFIIGHLHRQNFGMPVERDYVVIDFSKDIGELIEHEYQEIHHILYNGYNVREIYRNRNKYKITFKKVQ